MLFKVVRVYEIIKGMSIVNEEKRFKDIVLEYFYVKKRRSNWERRLKSDSELGI